MAKLVDAGDSKSPAARCVGSSPTLGTMENKPRFAVIFLPVIFASSPVYTSSLPNHLPILPKQSPNKRLIYPYLQSHCKSHTKQLCHYHAHVFLGKTRFMPALATHRTPIFNALRWCTWCHLCPMELLNHWIYVPYPKTPIFFWFSRKNPLTPVIYAL